MTYKFFIKNDSSKEVIGTKNFKNLDEAIKGFAEIKKLPIESFNKIFKVERHDQNRS